jgi:hypothetical protein
MTSAINSGTAGKVNISREELRNIRMVEAFNVAQAKREQRQLQKSARLCAESSSPVPDCCSEAPCSLGLQAAAEQALHFFSAATLPLHAAVPVAVCARTRKQKAVAASLSAASPPAVSAPGAQPPAPVTPAAASFVPPPSFLSAPATEPLSHAARARQRKAAFCPAASLVVPPPALSAAGAQIPVCAAILPAVVLASSSSGICQHSNRRSYCKDCGGSGICQHGKRRNICKDCGGSAICQHGRVRYQCKDCGGSGGAD